MTGVELVWIELVAIALCCAILLWAVAAQAAYAVALIMTLPRTLAGDVMRPYVARWADQPRLIGDALRWIECGWHYVALVLRLAHQAFVRYTDLLYQCEERWGCVSIAARCVYGVFRGFRWVVLELRRGAPPPTAEPPPGVRVGLMDGIERLQLRPTPTAEPPSRVRERRAETGFGARTPQVVEPEAALQAPQAHEDGDETASGSPGSEGRLEAAPQALPLHDAGGAVTPTPRPPRGSRGQGGDAATVSDHQPSGATLQGEPEPPASGGTEAQSIPAPQRQTRKRSGAMYPPDVSRRAARTIDRTLATRPTIVGLLGPLSLAVRASDGSIMQLRPLPRSEQRILAALAAWPEINDRVRLARRLWPGDSETRHKKSTRLRAYLTKCRRSYRDRLSAADTGSNFAEAQRRAERLLPSGTGYIGLAREEFATDLEVVGLIDGEALNCVDGDPLVAVALWGYVARLVRGVPLHGLDAPLRRSNIAWNTEWMKRVQERDPARARCSA